MVSIPRSEFWSFGRHGLTCQSYKSHSFNSSVGILVVRTRRRDRCRWRLPASFNSSVGILVVRTWNGCSVLRGQGSSFNSSVGILVVRTPPLERRVGPPACFNSSVGILVVRTRESVPICCILHLFQFLGRNSGRSDFGSPTETIRTVEVSIPRSEFWSFGPRYRFRCS